MGVREAVVRHLNYERREFIAFITFNQPQTLNAMTTESWYELRNTLKRAKKDDDVRATVLQGAGSAFSAGDDIGEMADWESANDGVDFLTTRFCRQLKNCGYIRSRRLRRSTVLQQVLDVRW